MLLLFIKAAETSLTQDSLISYKKVISSFVSIPTRNYDTTDQMHFWLPSTSEPLIKLWRAYIGNTVNFIDSQIVMTQKRLANALSAKWFESYGFPKITYTLFFMDAHICTNCSEI